MPRRVLSILLARLERSSLPLTDPVRLELERERELVELLVEVDRRRPRLTTYEVGDA